MLDAAHTGGVATGGPSPRVELRGIAKSFGAVKALTDVTFTALPGRVHALLGENGAGKTTLMRILYGLTRPDAGSINVNGERVDITGPRIARQLGIGMVTQHFALVGPMTVAENLLLTDVGSGMLNLAAARKRVRELSEVYGLEVDPDAVVEDLPVGGRQRVEILKALSGGCSSLVLDEPTAVLAPTDVASLFALIRRLCTESDLAVIFISHKMHEVLEISDDVSVLRRGVIVDSQENRDLDVHKLTRLMVGADSPALEALAGAVQPQHAQVRSESDQVVLRVCDLTVVKDGATTLKGVTFEVTQGEIVGIAGVTGNGQSELIEALLGVSEPESGVISIQSRDVVGTGVRGRRAAGLAGVGEDRHRQVVGELTVAENLALTDPSRFAAGPMLRWRAVNAWTDGLISQFAIKGKANQTAGTLSGGNMQKVLLARMFEAEPLVAVVAQPTRGLDVMSTAQIREELSRRARGGTAVIVVSEDLDEVLQLADRVLVLFDGALVGDVPAAKATPEHVGLLMTGAGVA